MKKTLLSIACLLSTLFSNAQSGEALSFDGINDYVDIGTVITQTNSYTKEAWIYANASGSNNIISSTNSPFWLSGGQLSVAHAWGSGFILSDPSSFPFNTWTHVAVTYDSSTNTMILYKNGVVVASSNSAPAYVAEDIHIGAYQASNFFQGMIDEVRLWDVVRTQCEINSYMNCEIPSSSAGLVANYHFNQGIVFSNNSSETILTDATGNNSGTLNNFSLNNSSSNWVSPGAVVTGSITPSVCPPASALNFDGADDEVELNPINISGNSARTVEFWIKTTNTGSFQNPFSSGSANQDAAFNVKVTPSGYLGLMGFGNDIYPSSGTYIADNTFHHVAITYDGTTATAYVDGNHEWDFSTNLNTIGEDNYIGQSNHGGNEQYFGGTIDELRIWNVVRSQCEIISYKNCEIPSAAAGLVANYHFNQGFDMMSNPLITTLSDASGNAIDGTLFGFVLEGSGSNWVTPGAVVSGFTTSITCPYAAALNFDGYDDYVLMPDATINDLSTGTIETWVYLESNTEEVICAKQHNFTGSYAILAVGISGTPGQISFEAKNGSIVYSNVNLSTGQWYHVAATFNGLEASLYVNGVLDATASGDFYIPDDLSTDGTSIGAWLGDGGGKYLDGQIDEFRVWNTERTQCEINTYMNSEIVSSTSNLVANYHFNQGLASYSNPGETTLSDVSGNGNDGSLSNFYLNGSTSNWVAPGGVVSGYTTTLAPPVITVNSGTICAGQSFTMVPNGAVTYTYSSGTDVVTPTSDATYSVSGTASTGCVSLVDAIASVTVNTLPIISVNSGTICAGQSFTMMPSGATTYSYSGGTDVVMPTSDATYSVSGTDVNGCVSDVDAISSIMVNALPTLTATTTNSLLCTGETAILTITGTATSYTWSTLETTATISVTPTSQTTFTVNGTDANGCTNTTTITQDVSLCTGIASINTSDVMINVYPNPNNGLFYIELTSDSKVSITNALGQIIVNETMSVGKHELDIHNQTEGIYFVKVIQKNNQRIIKIIKK